MTTSMNTGEQHLARFSNSYFCTPYLTSVRYTRGNLSKEPVSPHPLALSLCKRKCLKVSPVKLNLTFMSVAAQVWN